ncbi:hypothetical protein EB40_01654 [Enterococcus faecium]|nr:hypothetical protein EB40_01654 [Enterococcus faecium]
MKNYDPNIRLGTHTIKVSFQRWDYKGFVTFRRGGNCKGLDVLALDEDDLYDQTLTDNPIGFGLLPEDDEGNEWFKMTLMNGNGDELSVEDTWSYLKDAAFIEDPQHNQVILKGKSYGKEIQTALPSEEFALGNPFRFSLETVSEVAKRKNEIYYEQQLSQKERV